MQDGASPHRAKETISKLNRRVPDFIKPQDWPPYSPDLNWIENLWAQMDEWVYVEPIPKTRRTMQERLKSVWSSISRDTLRTLARSMPRRLQECLDNDGGKTHY